MHLEAFHLDEPAWLWGWAFIPLLWLAFFFFASPRHPSKRLEAMIDAHLLPFLQVEGRAGRRSKGMGRLCAWSFLWVCLMLALAGPRWSFREVEMRSKDASLVLLLDLSESMNATDLKPSRLVRAKQKIEDLLRRSQGVKVGLIAFAADPHLIAPLTEDKETLRHLLPSLDTDLVYVQGSRLSPALTLADKVLGAEPGNHQAVVVLSDGDFEDRSAIAEAKKLADKGIVVHAMGMGTVEGALLRDGNGRLVKKNGKGVLSKLERGPLEELSKAGRGLYFEPFYSTYEDSAILDALQSHSETFTTGKKRRLWDERFALFLLPALPLLLWWFRRGAVVLSVVWALWWIPCTSLQAGIVQECFRNSEQAGAEAFERGEYEEAAQSFQDPYRKGVACYKAGQFAEAETWFRQSAREEVACEAGYNLGNALAQQQKFEEAIAAYEGVLKNWPDHHPSQQNLDLLKKAMEQQQRDKSQEGEKDDRPKRDDSKEKDDSSGHDKNPDREAQDPPAPQAERGEQKDEEVGREPEQPSAGQETLQRGDVGEQKGREEGDPEGGQSGEKGDASSETRSQADLDADIWLNRLSNDPKTFLKNKFYLESKKKGTREGVDPW